MGDIVACTPFATWLRLEHPRSLIVWVARTPYHEVLRGNSHINAVLSLYCITEWIWLKKFQRICDQVYDLLISESFCEKCREVFRKGGAAGMSTVRITMILVPFSAPTHVPPAALLTKETLKYRSAGRQPAGSTAWSFRTATCASTPRP